MAKRTTTPASASLFQASIFQLKNVTPIIFSLSLLKSSSSKSSFSILLSLPKCLYFSSSFLHVFVFFFFSYPAVSPLREKKWRGPSKSEKLKICRKKRKPIKKKENDGRKVRGACLHDVGGMGVR